MTLATPGSISHGTLRTEDLLNTFFQTLESMLLLNGEHYAKPENFKERDWLNKLIGEAQDCFSEDGSTIDPDYEDGAAELIQDLMDALNLFAPEGCYFGAHEGDGSDFGYWPNRPETIEYTLPAYWASYLINGDASGLEDGEQEEIDAFLEKEGNPNIVSCGEESWFARDNDANSLGGDVMTFTALAKEENE